MKSFSAAPTDNGLLNDSSCAMLKSNSQEMNNEKLYAALLPNSLISEEMLKRDNVQHEQNLNLLYTIQKSKDEFQTELNELEKEIVIYFDNEKEKIEKQQNLSIYNKNNEDTKKSAELDKKQIEIDRLKHENSLLCDRVSCLLKKNAEKEKEKLESDKKCEDLMNQLKALYNSLSQTQTHVQTILSENKNLNKKIQSKDSECEKRLEEWKFKLKAEMQIRKAAEKDALVARERVASLEMKVMATAKETHELREIVEELRSSNGLLHTIAKIRNSNNKNIIGFDALIKKIEKVSKKDL